jgi:hypothetical protein
MYVGRSRADRRSGDPCREARVIQEEGSLRLDENPIQPSKRRFAAAVLAIAVAALFGCTRPTADKSTLKAIKAECQLLMKTQPIEIYPGVPKSRWPQVIASLKPESVTVSQRGVDILVRPYFDGGWGYFVPRSKRDEPPAGWGRYSDLGQGVYWFHPY